MRMSILDWIRVLEDFKRRGIKVIHRSALEAIYRGKDASLSVVINRLEKKGLVKRITKNWICIPPCEIWEIVKVVFPTAYISLEWALHYHEIIDQEIKVITLVWPDKTRVVTNTYTFEIHKISKRLYFGFNEKNIADPEKALLDTIYIRKKPPPELNIELLNINKLLNYAEKFPKKVRNNVHKLIKEQF